MRLRMPQAWCWTRSISYDLHRTLELNPSEMARFQKSIADILNGKQALEPLLKGRLAASVGAPTEGGGAHNDQF